MGVKDDFFWIINSIHVKGICSIKTRVTCAVTGV